MPAVHPTELQLQRYLDQSLDPAQTERIKKHLKLCPSCGEAMAVLQQVEEILRRLPEEAPSEGFTDRLMARIDPTAADSFAQPAAGRKRRFRPELINAMVATAATYFLLSSGILKSLLHLNPSTLESSLAIGVAHVTDWVGRISSAFIS